MILQLLHLKECNALVGDDREILLLFLDYLQSLEQLQHAGELYLTKDDMRFSMAINFEVGFSRFLELQNL